MGAGESRPGGGRAKGVWRSRVRARHYMPHEVPCRMRFRTGDLPTIDAQFVEGHARVKPGLVVFVPHRRAYGISYVDPGDRLTRIAVDSLDRPSDGRRRSTRAQLTLRSGRAEVDWILPSPALAEWAESVITTTAGHPPVRP